MLLTIIEKTTKVIIIPSIIVILLIFNSCSKGSRNVIFEEHIPNNIILNDSLNQCIENSKLFIISLYKAYCSTIDSIVHPSYIDSFFISSNKGFKAQVIISTSHGSTISILPSQINSIFFNITDMPAQLQLLLGFDSYFEYRNSNNIIVPATTLQEAYNDLPICFSINFSYMFDNYCNMNSNLPKFVDDSDSTLAVIWNSELEYGIEKYNQQKAALKYLNIINGNQSFDWITTYANRIGAYLAICHIDELFIKSKFFRIAQAHPILKKLSDDISQKISRAKNDINYEYEPWQYKRDMVNFYKTAYELDVDSFYAEAYFDKNLVKTNDGHFLWYYADYNEFVKQWVYINSILFALYIVYHVLTIKFIKTIRIFSIFLLPIAVALNGWIFLLKKPFNMNFEFWMVPGILFIFISIFSILSRNHIKKLFG